MTEMTSAMPGMSPTLRPKKRGLHFRRSQVRVSGRLLVCLLLGHLMGPSRFLRDHRYYPQHLTRVSERDILICLLDAILTILLDLCCVFILSNHSALGIQTPDPLHRLHLVLQCIPADVRLWSLVLQLEIHGDPKWATMFSELFLHSLAFSV